MDGSTTFGQIQPFNNTEPTEYDNFIISEWFFDYLTRYLTEITLARGNKQQPKRDREDKDFFGILHIIAKYLLSSDECKSVTPSEHAEKVYQSRMVFPESMVSDADIDDNYSYDSLFQMPNEFDIWFHDLYYIPKKANAKDTLSWAKINRLRTQYEQLTDEQKEIHDIMIALQQLVKDKNGMIDKGTLFKLNMIVGDMKRKLGTMCQSPNVGRGAGANKFDTNEHLEYLAKAIIDIFDYTNPTHVKALIENFHDLYSKYRNEPDSPIYSIIHEFKTHVHNVKLPNNHRLILLAFMERSSDKKEVNELLKSISGVGNTEKMMRSLKTSISKKIAHYFRNHVGR